MRWHWPLSFISVIFLLPMIAAYGLLQHKASVLVRGPEKRYYTEPPLEVNLEQAQILHGKAILNKWVIIRATSPYETETSAEKHRTLLNKFYTALGADRDRVTIVELNVEHLYPVLQTFQYMILNPQQMCIIQYNPESFKHDQLLKDMRKLLKYSHV